MSKSSRAATSVAATSLRATRLAAVQARVVEIANSVRNATRVARVQQLQRSKHLLIMQQVQAVYTAHGLVAPTVSVRPLANKQRNPQSVAAGACKQVHSICDSNPGASRAEIIELCKQVGINPATASTQRNIWIQRQKALAAGISDAGHE